MYGKRGGPVMFCGKRIHLRAVGVEDLPLILTWMNDAETTGLASGELTLLAPEDGLRLLEKWRSPDRRYFGIEDRESGKLIGTVGFKNMDPKNRSAEVSLKIGDRGSRGRGVGGEVLDLLLEYGFQELGFHRIYLQVFAFNRAAIRCYEKCGFKHEGVRREELFRDGRFHDILIMGMLEDEYRQRI